MNLRETIRKQQDNWIKRLDGKGHYELRCEFCGRVEQANVFPYWHNCKACPVVKVLMPRWKGKSEACYDLPSWDKWDHLGPGEAKGEAARAVLADVNKIAKHYHYAVREE